MNGNGDVNYHNDTTDSRGIANSDEEDGEGSRKKLRLSKDQSAILEESFKGHNNLNPKQKQALAKQLNLRPRQVEVWFQNRRARLNREFFIGFGYPYFLSTLKANHVPPFLVRKVFTQIFSFINVQLFNSNGEYVKARLTKLEHRCYKATYEVQHGMN